MPNYGSRGASCHAEFELDVSSFDNGGANRFQEAAQQAFNECRRAVETELGVTGETLQSSHDSNRYGGQHSSPQPQNHNGNGHTGGNAASNTRMATSSQVRAIHAIANRSRVDLPGLLTNQFGVQRPDDLSIQDASALIDQLKGSTTSGNGAVSR